MGHDAMKLNQVGIQNVAIGDLALGNNTNDSGLVAIGYHALQNDNAYAQGSTSGNGENTAIGCQALQLTTIGYGNTANGYSALAANTSGNWNTAIGDSALSGNTSGVFNIAIGFEAGVYLSSGSDNIYIGSLGASADSAVIRIGSDQTTDIHCRDDPKSDMHFSYLYRNQHYRWFRPGGAVFDLCGGAAGYRRRGGGD